MTLQNGATLAASATTTLNANRGVTLGTAGGTLASTAGTFTIAGVLTGGAALTITGAGTVALTGTNNATFTGPITVNGGTLSVASDANLGEFCCAALPGGRPHAPERYAELDRQHLALGGGGNGITPPGSGDTISKLPTAGPY